jgi:SAM-dependent methyltransferase
MPILYSARLGALDRWKNDLAMAIRKKVFRQFWRTMRPSREMRVADFGVSGHRDHPAHYFFETLYPWKDRLTAIGRAAENAEWMPQQFPGLTFVEADLRSIPLPDDYFDIGICNAVIEHAGTYDQQMALVREVCRVCRKVMFTTPNKGFPVEVHTFVPFAHWLPDPQFRTVLRTLGHHELAPIEQLNPLDARTLLSLFPSDRETLLEGVGLPLLRTNLVCVSTAR